MNSVILPVFEWFLTSHTWVLALFLIFFVSLILRTLILGRR